MNDIFYYLSVLFVLGSFFGWILELVFRKITHKRWINPGFLTGPYLPIYGLGLIMLYLTSIIRLPFESIVVIYIVKILSIGLLMTGIEYVAGVIFIKIMGIKLWDYSKRWGNIQGIICPLFSIIWTLVGAIYLFFVHDIIIILISAVSTNLYYPFLVGIFFGLFLWDLFSTLEISKKLKNLAKESKLIIRYEDFKLKERHYYTENKIKYNFMKPLRMNSDIIKELVLTYKDENKKN